jgi:hypothetical protein
VTRSMAFSRMCEQQELYRASAVDAKVDCSCHL